MNTLIGNPAGRAQTAVMTTNKVIRNTDMLLSLTPANDARTHLSRVVPSLLVEGLTIAGA